MQAGLSLASSRPAAMHGHSGFLLLAHVSLSLPLSLCQCSLHAAPRLARGHEKTRRASNYGP